MPESAVGKVEATVIVIDGAPPIDDLVADLRREVLDVRVATLDWLDKSPHPERAVVLLWLPPALPARFFERVVAWAAERSPPAGLIGITCAGTATDVEAALAAGFDDFVAGTRGSREIAARLRALHRRVHWPGLRRPGRIRLGDITLNLDGHELWMDGHSITLTGTELGVVRALIRAGGRTLTRSEILDAAWGDGNLDVSERAVDNVVLRLRRKLHRPGVIQTVRGVGFRLAAE